MTVNRFTAKSKSRTSINSGFNLLSLDGISDGEVLPWYTLVKW